MDPSWTAATVDESWCSSVSLVAATVVEPVPSLVGLSFACWCPCVGFRSVSVVPCAMILILSRKGFNESSDKDSAVARSGVCWIPLISSWILSLSGCSRIRPPRRLGSRTTCVRTSSADSRPQTRLRRPTHRGPERLYLSAGPMPGCCPLLHRRTRGSGGPGLAPLNPRTTIRLSVGWFPLTEWSALNLGFGQWQERRVSLWMWRASDPASSTSPSALEPSFSVAGTSADASPRSDHAAPNDS